MKPTSVSAPNAARTILRIVGESSTTRIVRMNRNHQRGSPECGGGRRPGEKTASLSQNIGREAGLAEEVPDVEMREGRAQASAGEAVEESLLVFRRWQDAAVALPEEAISMARDEVVGSIEQPHRQNSQHAGCSPRPTQSRQHEEGCARPGQVRRLLRLVVPNHDESVQPGGTAAEPSQLPGGDCTLEGREVKFTSPIALEHGLDHAVAEPALTVVEKQMAALRPARAAHAVPRHALTVTSPQLDRKSTR